MQIANEAVIFADGDPCPLALTKALRKGRFTLVLDGAAEAVRKQKWLPDLVSGDFDTVKPATLRHFQRKGVGILPTPDQNHTDLEKAIAWCVLRSFDRILIAQALGGRVDHSLTNLGLLKRYHAPNRQILLVQPQEVIRYVKDSRIKLSGRKGRTLAVLPFPLCRVRSRGLKYEMRGMELELGRRESSCNSARTGEVHLTIEGEALVAEGGVFRDKMP
ncbi:MAG TPA: thiamine diphosphokinase [Bdellovibrionota bacterium]